MTVETKSIMVHISASDIPNWSRDAWLVPSKWHPEKNRSVGQCSCVEVFIVLASVDY